MSAWQAGQVTKYYCSTVAAELPGNVLAVLAVQLRYMSLSPRKTGIQKKHCLNIECIAGGESNTDSTGCAAQAQMKLSSAA